MRKPVTSYIEVNVLSEVERIAKQEGLSRSLMIETLVRDGVRQKLHQRHSVLLQPIIEQAIKREMSKFSTRLALLLVRANFDIGQVRSLTTNILGRQTGVTPEILTKILDHGADRAKQNITRSTPQIETIIEEVAKWFKEDQNTNNGNSQSNVYQAS